MSRQVNLFIKNYGVPVYIFATGHDASQVAI